MTESSTVSLGLVLSIVGPLIGMLMAGNLYFLKLLIEKIRRFGEEMPQLSNAISQLNILIAGMERRNSDMALEIRNIKRLESRVSYLEGALRAGAADEDEGNGALDA